MPSVTFPRHQPLHALHVVGIRYRGSRLAAGDDRSLDAYAAADVYATATVPVMISEPTLAASERGDDEPANLGRIGGQIATTVAEAMRAGRAPLVVGGDCSHSVGVFAGLQQVFGADARIGLVWFDAHGDFNTPQTSLSQMLGGMPVAVCAGLAYPQWREGAGVRAPLPTDRILFVDVRNLDAPEAQLLHATAATVAAVAPGFPGAALGPAVAALAARCDLLYLHIDSDILDAALVPNHGTREPNGPDRAQVARAIDTVLATGAVAACAVVSVYGEGPGSAVSVESGTGLIRATLEGWARYGAAAAPALSQGLSGDQA